MRLLHAFLDDQRGSQTVEFIVWIPLIAMLLVMVTDASLLYLNHSQMWTVARDATRNLSDGQMKPSEAQSYALNALSRYGNYYRVSTVPENDTIPIGTTVQTIIKVQVQDVSPFGFFIRYVLGKDMVARVAMRADPLANALWQAAQSGGGNGNGGGSSGGGSGGTSGGSGGTSGGNAGGNGKGKP